MLLFSIYKLFNADMSYIINLCTICTPVKVNKPQCTFEERGLDEVSNVSDFKLFQNPSVSLDSKTPVPDPPGVPSFMSFPSFLLSAGQQHQTASPKVIIQHRAAWIQATETRLTGRKIR